MTTRPLSSSLNSSLEDKYKKALQELRIVCLANAEFKRKLDDLQTRFPQQLTQKNKEVAGQYELQISTLMQANGRLLEKVETQQREICLNKELLLAKSLLISGKDETIAKMTIAIQGGRKKEEEFCSLQLRVNKAEKQLGVCRNYVQELEICIHSLREEKESVPEVKEENEIGCHQGRRMLADLIREKAEWTKMKEDWEKKETILMKKLQGTRGTNKGWMHQLQTVHEREVRLRYQLAEQIRLRIALQQEIEKLKLKRDNQVKSEAQAGYSGIGSENLNFQKNVFENNEDLCSSQTNNPLSLLHPHILQPLPSEVNELEVEQFFQQSYQKLKLKYAAKSVKLKLLRQFIAEQTETIAKLTLRISGYDSLTQRLQQQLEQYVENSRFNLHQNPQYQFFASVAEGKLQLAEMQIKDLQQKLITEKQLIGQNGKCSQRCEEQTRRIRYELEEERSQLRRCIAEKEYVQGQLESVLNRIRVLQELLEMSQEKNKQSEVFAQTATFGNLKTGDSSGPTNEDYMQENADLKAKLSQMTSQQIQHQIQLSALLSKFALSQEENMDVVAKHSREQEKLREQNNTLQNRVSTLIVQVARRDNVEQELLCLREQLEKMTLQMTHSPFIARMEKAQQQSKQLMQAKALCQQKIRILEQQNSSLSVQCISLKQGANCEQILHAIVLAGAEIEALRSILSEIFEEHSQYEQILQNLVRCIEDKKQVSWEQTAQRQGVNLLEELRNLQKKCSAHAWIVKNEQSQSIEQQDQRRER